MWFRFKANTPVQPMNPTDDKDTIPILRFQLLPALHNTRPVNGLMGEFPIRIKRFWKRDLFRRSAYYLLIQLAIWFIIWFPIIKYGWTMLSWSLGTLVEIPPPCRNSVSQPSGRQRRPIFFSCQKPKMKIWNFGHFYKNYQWLYYGAWRRFSLSLTADRSRIQVWVHI